MKIHMDNVSVPGTGPGTFASRLASQLQKLGHEILFEAGDASVSLVFIERSGKPLAPKVVQRLDGIWFKPDEFIARNVQISSLYNKADAVVFQSQFDKSMVEKWWGERQKPDTIIGNGIDMVPVQRLTLPALIEMRNQYDRIFVCSSNWHAQKRLRDNIALFQRLRTIHPNSCLIVMGSNPDCIVADPHVFYAGHTTPDVYMQVYAAADWMLHLAWADHCPNVVVEALSQGTPVICSEVGGTKEMIGHGTYGMVLREQEPYNFQLYDYDNPPSIDVGQVTFLPDRLEFDYASIPSIDIKDVAEQYISLFERLVRQ